MGRRVTRGLFLSAFLGASIGSAAGAIVIFKDGFLAHGRVRQREDLARDNGQVVTIRKGEVYLDDGARYIKFPHAQVDYVDNQEQEGAADPIRLTTPRVSKFASDVIPSLWKLDDTSDWDDKWQRTTTAVTMKGTRIDKIYQRLAFLTPRVARIDALRYSWSEWFLTRELDPQKVRDLLYRHPELKLAGNSQDAGRRLRVCRFLAEAGWYELAESELSALDKAFPAEKDNADGMRAYIAKARATERLEEIETARRAGRHAWVQSHLADFPEQSADEKQLAALRALRAQYAAAATAFQEANGFLVSLPPRVAGARAGVFGEAAKAIREELGLDEFLPSAERAKKAVAKHERLRNFVDLAKQAQRDIAAGRIPAHSPDELLALAMTGWLLGPEGAVPKPAAAERLWKARRFVLEYQATPRAGGREKLLSDYQKRGSEALSTEELAALIAFLPPPDPAPAQRGTTATWQIQSRRGQRRIRYHVQTPPEYRLGRSYPVLFSLHDGDEGPSEALGRWALARPHGYIVVAPEWAWPPGQAYAFTAAEHAAVVDVLHDVCRRYQIDCDRVFLSGFGDSATMAFDVGLAHPDLFAGVMPVEGKPETYIRSYWPNAQYLPFYVVNGGNVGDMAKDIDKMFDQWIPRGYPALQTVYKGRGREWFAGEVPNMLSWMDRKRRARAIPALGKGGLGTGSEAFVTLRPTDDRFYWVSTDEIDPEHLVEGQWTPRISPAALTGRISEGNQVTITAKHIPRLTVWLSTDMRDRIDLERPLTIRLNGGVSWNNRRVQPSTDVLLEDFYARGDRERLFLAKVELGRKR